MRRDTSPKSEKRVSPVIRSEFIPGDDGGEHMLPTGVFARYRGPVYTGREDGSRIVALYVHDTQRRRELVIWAAHPL